MGETPPAVFMTKETDPRWTTLVRVFSERLVKHVNENGLKQMTVLDIGAYNAHLTHKIEDEANGTLGVKAGETKRIKIIAFDPLYNTEDGMGLAINATSEENTDGHIYVSGKGEALPFAENSLDLVMAIDALHHSDYPFDVVREMYRVVKPGGKLIIKDHNPDNTVDLIKAAFSDILGNTTNKMERIKQMAKVVKTVIINGKKELVARLNEPHEPLETKDLHLRGEVSGDTSLAFNYITENQWEKIWNELGLTAENNRFIYDYIKRLPKMFHLIGEFVDQKNCLYEVVKPAY